MPENGYTGHERMNIRLDEDEDERQRAYAQLSAKHAGVDVGTTASEVAEHLAFVAGQLEIAQNLSHSEAILVTVVGAIVREFRGIREELCSLVDVAAGKASNDVLDAAREKAGEVITFRAQSGLQVETTIGNMDTIAELLDLLLMDEADVATR